MRYRMTVLIALCLAVGGAAPAHADGTDQAIETGRLLAILLDAGRVTVGLHQDLLNDPSKGQKNFTAPAFEKQLLAVFRERTGIDLSDLTAAPISAEARTLLARLLEESRKTIDSYQTVINMPGIRYKGLIPATFGTETAKRFQNWSGVYLKQTAPESLLRNPKNKPDEYETAAFEKLTDPAFARTRNAIISEVVDDGKTLRVMLPLYYGKACLSCHGEPKGERDISGYPREGAKEGDLGGAISVKIPVK
ncbi:Tll0287-like domain-containing protein [Nitrospira moscoviensis]|uniref:Tll0287-like domain-containing protein n=1 Tax=Nitrospira moscoviensis TaxID=42253 RepID=A0A0K2GA34_NITMO|nr:DUF3365 domain-containing protein [Nitrospira moscoviensis]ALA57813.1 conserved exported protein of unknown function [Nitrospira moscoviensis]